MTKRALISVSNKTGIIEFAKGLNELGYEILSTGGTLKQLQEANVNAIAVDDITKFPEIWGGRVKTLHPNIHGGLLAKRDNESHVQELETKKIDPIDLVVVNLYPFKETLAKTDVSHNDIVENIDIGGPTMLRAAAKNYQDVTVIVDPEDYDDALTLLEKDELTKKQRKQFAAKVYRHTAHYDGMIANYFTEETGELFTPTFTRTFERVQSLRYGENPYQEATFYELPNYKGVSLATANQLHGKELSYNNIKDTNKEREILLVYIVISTDAYKNM